MRRRQTEPVKPKKIIDSDVRKQLQLAYIEEAKITNRVFELMDVYLGRNPRVTNKQFEHAPDWIRPIAALSFKIGVNHEDIAALLKAGQRRDWDTVDLLLMAYED